jgi:hypothetical protein
MNLNNIKLELNKISKEQIDYLDIYLGEELIPIRILRGIDYFVYKDKLNLKQEIFLNKKHWFVCIFCCGENNHYCQEKMPHIYSEEGLYKLINNFTPNRKQFIQFNLALEFALNNYIRFLNKKLINLNITPNTNIKFFKIEEINKLIKREELNNL